MRGPREVSLVEQRVEEREQVEVYAGKMRHRHDDA
jgi:hypothetical protein